MAKMLTVYSSYKFLPVISFTFVKKIYFLMLREYSQEELQQLLLTCYNVKGTLKQLAGYYDHNYLVKDTQNPHLKTHILKISRHQEEHSILQFQTYVLSHIKNLKTDPCHYPQLVQTIKGEDIMKLQHAGKVNYVRLFKFVQGEQLTQEKNLPPHIFVDVGIVTAKLLNFLGQLSSDQKAKDLVTKINMAEYIQNIWTFPKLYEVGRAYLDQDMFELVDSCKTEWDQVQKYLQIMPKQIIHNDICLTNLLAIKKGEQITLSGVIDFNSLVYCEPIIQLVVVAARINLDDAAIFKNMMLVIKGFTSIRALTKEEKQVLFPLIKVRLAFLCLLSWRQFSLNNQGEYMVAQMASMKHYIKIFSKVTNEEFLKELQKTIN